MFSLPALPIPTTHIQLSWISSTGLPKYASFALIILTTSHYHYLVWNPSFPFICELLAGGVAYLCAVRISGVDLSSGVCPMCVGAHIVYFYHLINFYVSGSRLDIGNIKTKPNPQNPPAFQGFSWEPQQKKLRVCKSNPT